MDTIYVQKPPNLVISIKRRLDRALLSIINCFPLSAAVYEQENWERLNITKFDEYVNMNRIIDSNFLFVITFIILQSTISQHCANVIINVTHSDFSKNKDFSC